MKTLFTIFFVSLLTLSASPHPADSVKSGDTSLIAFNDDVTTAIAAAIRAGDSRKLASYFNATIDLTVPGSDGTYSKSQAEMIVRNFFTQYPPASFNINQEGNSNEGSRFSIGTYVSKGKKFRTYFLIKRSGGVSLIHQLQFEED